MFSAILSKVAERGEAVQAVSDQGGFVEITPKPDCLDRVIALFGQEYETRETQYGKVWVRPAH